MKMTSQQKGNYGMASAIEYCASQGWTVSIPLTDTQSYDIIADIDGKLCKIQVKYTASKSNKGSWIAELKRTSIRKSTATVIHRFDHSAVDYLFILAGDGSRWMIPTSAVDAGCAIWLGEKYKGYKV